MLVASAELEPSQIQELGDVMPKLLEVKAKANIAMRFTVRVEVGGGKAALSEEVAKGLNALLNQVKDGFQLS